MIEIKFKGKIKNVLMPDKDGQWVKGFYRYQPYYDIHTICFFKEEKEFLIDGIGCGGGWKEYVVDPETVSQFSGFRDKKGKEIYFDDLVKHKDSIDVRVGKVVWNKCMCCMGIEFKETTVFGGENLFEQCEVIEDQDQKYES